MAQLLFVLFTLLFTAAKAQSVEDYVAPSVATTYKTTDALIVSLAFPVTLGYNRHPDLEIDIIPRKGDGSSFDSGQLLVQGIDVLGGVVTNQDFSGGDGAVQASIVIQDAIENIHANSTIQIVVYVDDPSVVASILVRLSPSGNQHIPANQKREACEILCDSPSDCADYCSDRPQEERGDCQSACVVFNASCRATCMGIGALAGLVDLHILPEEVYSLIRFEECTVQASVIPAFFFPPTPITGWVEVDGPTDCRGMTAPSDLGCSSNEANATSSSGDVVGCAGAFAVNGIHQWPTCGHASGPFMAYGGWSPAGDACSADDICAPGWHVCHSSSEVQVREPNGCAGLDYHVNDDRFFATVQSTCGFGTCCPDGTNDIVGCANFPMSEDADALVSCNPLDAYSGEDCHFLPEWWGWDCGDDDYDSSVPDTYLITNNTAEADIVRKTNPQGGGVLCCRD